MGESETNPCQINGSPKLSQSVSSRLLNQSPLNSEIIIKNKPHLLTGLGIRRPVVTCQLLNSIMEQPNAMIVKKQTNNIVISKIDNIEERLDNQQQSCYGNKQSLLSVWEATLRRRGERNISLWWIRGCDIVIWSSTLQKTQRCHLKCWKTLNSESSRSYPSWSASSKDQTALCLKRQRDYGGLCRQSPYVVCIVPEVKQAGC